MPNSYPHRETPSTGILRHAVALAARGWAVFPAGPKKTPLRGSRGVRDATRDPEALQRLFAQPGAALVAIATGTPSGISALDIDRQHGGANWWRENRERLPSTLAWRTRSGGIHVIFQHRPEIRTVGLGKIGAGVEIRSSGASVIYWPANGRSILCDAPPAPMPQWLMPPPAPVYAPPAPSSWEGNDRRARAYAEGALRRAVRAVASAGPGTRNAALNCEAFGLSRLVATGALAADEIAYALATAALTAGLDGRETAATIRSALRARGAA